MFKRSTMALLGLVAVDSAASAADLPRLAPPPPTAFTWTGFYIGANVGDAFDGRTSETTTGIPTRGFLAIVPQSLLTVGAVPTQHRLGGSGIAAGGQIGYNLELPLRALNAGVVAGVEADGNYVGIRRNDTVVTTFGLTNAYQASSGFLGTVRGRLGLAFDRWLVYGTGGLAYGNNGYSHTVETNAPPIAPVYSGGANGTKAGYAAGGGVEYALPTNGLTGLFSTGKITVRAEYLHYDLGGRTTVLNPVAPFGFPGTGFVDTTHMSGNIVRAGLNILFDTAAPAPVVARY